MVFNPSTTPLGSGQLQRSVKEMLTCGSVEELHILEILTRITPTPVAKTHFQILHLSARIFRKLNERTMSSITRASTLT